jgi:hypothetical protein
MREMRVALVSDDITFKLRWIERKLNADFFDGFNAMKPGEARTMAQYMHDVGHVWLQHFERKDAEPRCGNCDGSLAEFPDVRFCSTFCEMEARGE